MVDHQGTGVSDGGHTRAVMANDLQADGSGSIHSAQATQSEAAIRSEGLSSFSGEEHVWILRPNRPREGQPTAPTSPTTPSPQPGAGTYTVKAGDTLSQIAKRTLGDASRWRELAALNPGVDPAKLRVGVQLKVP